MAVSKISGILQANFMWHNLYANDSKATADMQLNDDMNRDAMRIQGYRESDSQLVIFLDIDARVVSEPNIMLDPAFALKDDTVRGHECIVMQRILREELSLIFDGSIVNRIVISPESTESDMQESA